MTIIVEKCRRCGCCVRSCPRHALKLGADSVEVGDACIGCGTCVAACPFDAIAKPAEGGI